MEKCTKFIHEGKYAAEVEIELIPDDDAWGPYIGHEDMLKLERVRMALRNGDIAAAKREAEIFELTPVA